MELVSEEERKLRPAKWQKPEVEDTRTNQTEMKREPDWQNRQENMCRPQPRGYCYPRVGALQGGCYPGRYIGWYHHHKCPPRHLCYPRAYYQY
ncbi:hypothetical protein [Anaerosinus sp.]